MAKRRIYANANITDLIALYLTMKAARVCCTSNVNTKLWRSLNEQLERVRDELTERGVEIPNTHEGNGDIFAIAWDEAARLHRTHNRARVAIAA